MLPHCGTAPTQRGKDGRERLMACSGAEGAHENPNGRLRFPSRKSKDGKPPTFQETSAMARDDCR